ncbi:MAG TPA: DUF1846 domain-containing protein [Bacillota bacterium]|nr:DUF1846 domain-containing protein [Bacillota bacterium]
MHRLAFDTDRYLAAQNQAIVKRLEIFSGKLYLEFGGKLLFDYHAARVLPGYHPDAKLRILRSLKRRLQILFCVAAPDIQRGRVRGDFGLTYDNATLKSLEDLLAHQFEVFAVVITRYQGEERASRLAAYLESRDIRVYLQPELDGYPEDVDRIVSDDGYGRHQPIPTTAPLVIVTGAGPGSGKMATCLAQVYHHRRNQVEAGFAKFETFPVWGLAADHPVNLAYEAATADIGDRVMIDPFHLQAYGISAATYNRDVENFRIMQRIMGRLWREGPYRSPTDMGVNEVERGIIDDEAASEAGRQELIRRYFRYRWEVLRRLERPSTVERVQELLDGTGTSVHQRVVVEPARRAADEAAPSGKGHKGVYCGAAIELPDGTIVTGKNSPLLHAEAAMALNAIKQLARLPDAIHLLSPSVIGSINHLKSDVLQGRSESLDLSETLIALAISAATNPAAELGLGQLPRLKNCEMHTTHAPSHGDEDALRKLGINVTTDARPVLHRFLVRPV